MLHVMRLLGNKNVKNTLVYMQLVDFEDCASPKSPGPLKQPANSSRPASNMPMTTENVGACMHARL